MLNICACFFIIILGSNYTSTAQGLSGGAAGARAANPDFPQLLEWAVQEKDLNYEIEGSPYIMESWTNATILFKSNEIIENIPVKYDLKENLMEIKTKKTIKVCPPERIIAFELNDSANGEVRAFVNCNQFKVEYSLVGFYEVLVDEEDGFMLLKKTEASIKESNYNPALDVGEMTAKIIKRDAFYIAKNKTAYSIPKRKKAFLKLFGKKSALIGDFVKREKSKLNDQEDLIKIIAYCNSI